MSDPARSARTEASISLHSTNQDPNPSAEGFAGSGLFAGRYRLLRVLGEGGLATSLEARHVGSGQRVTIKLLHGDRLDDTTCLQRLEREGALARRIHHRNVARVLDAGHFADAGPFLVTEYLEGRSLAQILRHRERLPLGEALALVRQACAGVHAAHGAGIVHLDVKPANLFLIHEGGNRPCLKLTDFGFAACTGDVVFASNCSGPGSPWHMAPEQFGPSPRANERVDVWSLGVLLYQLLTGRHPFEASNMQELCRQIMHGQPMAAVNHGSHLPPPILAVLDRCLAKNPSERFGGADELSESLLSAHPESASDADSLLDLLTESEPQPRPRRLQHPVAEASRRGPYIWQESNPAAGR